MSVFGLDTCAAGSADFMNVKAVCLTGNHMRPEETGAAKAGIGPSQGEEAMISVTRDPRISSLYESDCQGAWTIVGLLWLVTLFVLLMTWPYMPDQGVRIVAVIASALVLLFNTASVWVMVSNYAHDQDSA